MSELEAISIQGIRSFDPQNPQVLQFLKPVTLILGQNGTGKTTIIESLKYSTTGDFPPGSKLGGSFIHDPKIANETEVKAKVSLQIKNIKGEPMTVSRALKVTQKDKNKQVSLQTLDCSIKRNTSHGEEISISSKCADIDLEMTSSLGVSKAVLENVIFCHQEDANWPLGEGKAVKERFDDLFASSRYVKALDSIHKIKQEKMASLNLYKSELVHLKRDLDENNKKSREMNTLELQVCEFVEKINLSKEKLIPIEEAINKYQTQYKELCDIQKEKDMLVSEMRSTETRIQELEVNITEPIDCSLPELEQLIRCADSDLSDHRNTIKEEERKKNVLGTEIMSWQKQNQSLLLEKGALNSRIETNKNLQNEVDHSLKQLAGDLGISCDKYDSSTLIERMDSHVYDLESRRDQEKGLLDSELGSLQNSLSSKTAEQTKLEHEIDINKKSLINKKIDLKNLERRLEAVSQDSSKLTSIKEHLDNLKAELEQLKCGFDTKSARDELKNLSGSILEFDDQLAKLDHRLAEFRKDEEIFNQINSLELQRDEKSSSAKRLRSRNNPNLEAVFNNKVPEGNLKKLLDLKMVELRNKNNSSRSSLSSLQSKIAGLNIEMKQIKNQIAENEKLVETFDENVFQICGNFDLHSTLLELREKKAKLEEESLTIQSSVSLYSKFHKILLKDKSDCPLCHREFKHESEVDDLINEINEKCMNVPSKLDEISRELNTTNEKIEALIKLESQLSNVTKLKEYIIIELKNQLNVKKISISEIQIDITKQSQEIEVYANNEKLASSMLGDMANIEKYNDEVTIIERNLETLKKRITMLWAEFSEKYEILKSDKKTAQENLLVARKHLETKRKSYEECVNRENDLSSQINNLESEKLKIQKAIQEFANFEVQKQNLLDEIHTIDQQINGSVQKLVPVNEDLRLIRSNCERIQEQKRVFLSRTNLEITKVRSQIDSIKQSICEINKSNLEVLKAQLEITENKIFDLNRKIQNNLNSQEEIKSTIATINSKIGNHKIRQRELQDTLQIRHHRETIDRCERAIEKFDAQLGGINLSNILKQSKQFDNERRILREEIDKFETRKTQLQSGIDYITNELSDDRLANSHNNYLETTYKLKTSELAISDLDKYYKALDKAIMSYHHDKMAEINKILKQLWQNTYNGKDIEYIEICSDEDTSGAAAKKRNYNYRVVMVKSSHGARLDMRGRCSAGQKVLASILIRLALAEVFCLYCGVLALDEPTTNLDQENIESLAFALVEIIKTRSAQKNFQLVIITHDEDFVKLLSRSEFIDEFYRIRCNSHGHSLIESSRIDGRT